MEGKGAGGKWDFLLWPSFMMLWLGSGMQQCLQTLKHLLPVLARSFFKISHGSFWLPG